MKMKSFFTLLVACFATTALVACSDDSNDNGGGIPVSQLTVRPQSLSFDSEGGEQVIRAQAPSQATASSSADWCQVTVGTQYGDVKITPVTVTVAANPTTYERTAVITITAGSQTETVSVTQAEGSATIPSGSITKGAQDIAALMYPGWNLGNTLEATGSGLGAETSWQPTRTTQQIIDAVKAAGFRSVRIPCSWDIHSTNGTIDAEWLARVRQVVDYCINDGLYVVLNDHWDNGWIEVLGFSKSSSSYQPVDESDITAKISRLKELWTQIATAFSDYDEHLLFAGLNEPFQEYTLFSTRHAELTPILVRYNQAFVEAVRATGGNNAQRTLVVQGPSTSINSSVQYMPATLLPEAAGRLMVEVHYYDPGQFCGTYDASGDKAYYYWGADNHGPDHNPTYGEETYLNSQFAKLKTAYTSKGYPVIIGEYAALQRTIASSDQTKHDASVKHYYKYLNAQAIRNGIVPFAWDTNDTSGLGKESGSTTIIDRAKVSVIGSNAMKGIQEAVAETTWNN